MLKDLRRNEAETNGRDEKRIGKARSIQDRSRKRSEKNGLGMDQNRLYRTRIEKVSKRRVVLRNRMERVMNGLEQRRKR